MRLVDSRGKSDMKIRPLILASGSPRRQELLKLCGIPFVVEPSKAEEYLNRSVSLEEAIEQIARAKAEAVFALHPEALVLGADTIVTVDQEVLGKPKDREDAKRMLNLLQGRTHRVITGVCLRCEEETVCFHETAEVTFAAMSQFEVEQYVNSEEPYDKAGAYALQGQAAVFIRSINGDYYSIVGLPVHRVYEQLCKWGYR